jgi:hypothetical protein
VGVDGRVLAKLRLDDLQLRLLLGAGQRHMASRLGGDALLQAHGVELPARHHDPLKFPPPAVGWA